MAPPALKIGLGSRVYAFAALATLAADILVMAYLLISSLLVFLLAVGALVFALLTGWTALVSRGTRRVLNACLALTALAATVTLLGPVNLAGMLIVVGLTVASAAAARAAIGRHRPLALDGELPPGMVAVRRARRPVLLLNPLSGGGVVGHTGLAEHARRRGIAAVILRPEDDLRRIAEREVSAGATVIGVAGGDGSQAVVADVARRHNVAFVCVPTGTYNHFAQDLGIDRRDPVAALDAFGLAVEYRIDLATVNGRVFVNNVSIGVYATIVQSETYRDTRIATTAAMLPDLVGVGSTTFDLQFTGPDGQIFGSADLLLVSNNHYTVLTTVGLGSRPRLDAGELGIIAIRARRTGDAASSQILNWSAPSFRVDSAGPVAAGIDGEAVELQAPLEFASLRQALRVRLASGAIAPIAGARAPGVWQTVLTLLRIAASRPSTKDTGTTGTP